MALGRVALLAMAGTLATILACGCTKQELIQKFAPAQDQAMAKEYMDDLREGAIDRIEAHVDPSMQSPTLPATLQRMAALVPHETPDSVKLVGALSMRASGRTTRTLTFEYGFHGTWVLLSVVTQDLSGRTTLMGLHIQRLDRSVEELNRFTLLGKSTLEYTIFILAILLPLLTLYALVVCVRRKPPGRKWPWIVFILFGVGKVAVNWTTGAWAVIPISFQLFSASAVRPLYGAWTLAVSIPLGAIVFLLKPKPQPPEESRQITAPAVTSERAPSR
jgi:Phospholipase_D-nuclease N-terminal